MMPMRIFIAVAAVLTVTACSDSTPTTPTVVTTTAPYSQTDLVLGTGTIVANNGNRLTVSYAGWLHDSTKTDAKGKQFDSQPTFPFTLGVGQVIRGWDQGLVGMKIGGQRRLVLPPELAYGSTGAGTGANAIPPNATLVFDVTLLFVQ